jgi:hypothetical protein
MGMNIYIGYLINDSVPVVPTGEHLPAEYLRTSLANSLAFQNVTGTNSYATAIVHTYINGMDRDADLMTLAPFALIKSDGERSWERVGYGTDKYTDNGSLTLSFDIPIDGSEGALTDSGQLAAAIASCDLIINDLLDFSGQGGYLAIETTKRIEAFLPNEEDDEQLITVAYQIDWR